MTEISVLFRGYLVHLESGLLEQEEVKSCLKWDRDSTLWYPEGSTFCKTRLNDIAEIDTVRLRNASKRVQGGPNTHPKRFLEVKQQWVCVVLSTHHFH